MSYKLTIDQKPTYLHIIVTGHNSKETVMRYMEEVMRECTNRKCGMSWLKNASKANVWERLTSFRWCRRAPSDSPGRFTRWPMWISMAMAA